MGAGRQPLAWKRTGGESPPGLQPDPVREAEAGQTGEASSKGQRAGPCPQISDALELGPR